LQKSYLLQFTVYLSSCLPSNQTDEARRRVLCDRSIQKRREGTLVKVKGRLNGAVVTWREAELED
jgi:hypothetical protein